MKIRSKLTYQFLIIVASILLVFSLSIYYFSSDYREQEFYKRLTSKGLTTARLLIKVDEVDDNLLRIIDRNNLSVMPEERIIIYDNFHKKIYSSNDQPHPPLTPDQFGEIKTKGEVLFKDGKKEAIGIIYREKGKEFYVIISAYDRFGMAKLKNLRLILIIGYISSVGVIYLAGRLFSGQALLPISNIVSQVREISASNLDSRLTVQNANDEIGQLALQFNQMLERLESAFKMQKSFVSNASHELRNPLSIIRTQLEVALSHNRSQEEYRVLLGSLLEDINSMINLTNGLLDLAQIGNESMFAISKKIRVDELLVQSMSELIKKYPLQQINIKVQEDLEDEKMFIVHGIDSLLKTALLNILDNSFKFSDGKPVEVLIGVSGEKINIVISDNGIGINKGDLPHIFDPFYRGSNVRNTIGHGIGLSLSRKIVLMHNGDISINSTVNKGTMVMITLPLKT